MTRSTLAHEPTFDVPDLEIVAPRPRRAAPPAEGDEARASEYQYEPLFERDGSSRVIELDDTRPPSARPDAPHGFEPAAATTGVPISRFESSFPVPGTPLDPLAPPTKLDFALDVIQTIPFSAWKRVPVYAFLFWLFGNCMRCGGLSRVTTIGFALVFVLGLVGMVGSFCQRRP